MGEIRVTIYERVKLDDDWTRVRVEVPEGHSRDVSVASVTATIVIIAASGVLMMRFRKRWLAKINVAFTNRITSLFAGWLPGFGILTHVG
jgi:hypothetical protein